jgi:hypothetical protein
MTVPVEGRIYPPKKLPIFCWEFEDYVIGTIVFGQLERICSAAKRLFSWFRFLQSEYLPWICPDLAFLIFHKGFFATAPQVWHQGAAEKNKFNACLIYSAAISRSSNLGHWAWGGMDLSQMATPFVLPGHLLSYSGRMALVGAPSGPEDRKSQNGKAKAIRAQHSLAPWVFCLGLDGLDLTPDQR